MAGLRALLGELGCAEVVTHLQSGNAIFTREGIEPRLLEAELEGAIEGRFGHRVRVLVMRRERLLAVIAGNPYEPVLDSSRLLAHFLFEDPAPELLAVHDPDALDPGNVRLGDRVIYQWCPSGFQAAPATGAFVERYLKVAVTTRNWNTVTKLGALASG
jgi:uncharacterized protein (DUF1697 family)